MPEIIIYTNDGDCANGVAEIQPFTTGDATNEWTLRFNNGTDFYSVSNVTMRVGHVNGLPDATYNSAFKWNDRTGAESTARIVVSSGVPTLTFTSGSPAGGVVGTNGVYILRGPQLDGAISNVTLVDGGFGYAINRFIETLSGNESVYNKVSFTAVGSGSGFAALGTITEVTVNDGSGSAVNSGYGPVTSVSLTNGGKGYSLGDSVTDENNFRVNATGGGGAASAVTVRATLGFDINAAKYEFPFMRAESGNNIIAATTLSPYSDGAITDSTEFDHSTLVIRPETVATASSLTASTDTTGPKWTATMNPINAYVTERLALRNSTQLDLQIRGDGRTLFQGQLTILNKIA